MRRVDAAGKQTAGLHHLMPRVMHRRGRVVATAHEREFVGVLGVHRKNFRDFEARRVGLDRFERPADFSRGVRLHVKRVQLTGRAQIENHDHRALVVILGDRPLGFGGQEIRQRQPNGPQRADLQKITTRDAIARMRLASTGETKHGSVQRLLEAKVNALLARLPASVFR